MLSNNYNFIQAPELQQIAFQNSLDSTNGSFNSSSLLKAANTIFFDSSSADYQHSPAKSSSDFPKTILNVQIDKDSNQDDLDFELQYNYKSGFNNNLELLDEIDDSDLSSELERVIKGYEETNTAENATKRVLNNPISFVSNDFLDSTRKLNFSESPNSGMSFNSAYSTTPQNSFTIKQQTNRTLMKMQLMKQQTEQIEKKFARTNSCLSSSSTGHYDSATPTQNNHYLHNIMKPHSIKQHFNSVQIPNQNDFLTEQSGTQVDTGNMNFPLTTLEIIPRSVLTQAYQNEIKLDNPTKYHVQQIAKNLQQTTNNLRVTSNKASCSSSAKKHNSSASNQVNALNSNSLSSIISSEEIAILPNSLSFYGENSSLVDQFSSQRSVDSNSNSNFNPTRLSSPTDSSFSQNDFLDEMGDYMIDEFESLINQKSVSLANIGIQEEIIQIEDSLNLPKTLPNENSLYNLHSPSSFTQQTSSSCPAEIARIKHLQGLNLTAEEIKMIVKDRQKKDNHNIIERRRRFNINDRIKELGTILPKSGQGDIKQNKGSILKASVDYIKSLRQELNRSKQAEEKLRQMALLNRKLIIRIKELEQKNKSIYSDNDKLQVKTEPEITLRNLVTTTVSPTQIFLNQNWKESENGALLNSRQFHSSQANISSQQIDDMVDVSEGMIINETFSLAGDEPLMCNFYEATCLKSN